MPCYPTPVSIGAAQQPSGEASSSIFSAYCCTVLFQRLMRGKPFPSWVMIMDSLHHTMSNCRGIVAALPGTLSWT